VKFILCWTPDGAETEDQCTRTSDGTGLAIRLASRNNVPVFNMKNHGWHTRLAQIIKPTLQDAWRRSVTPRHGLPAKKGRWRPIQAAAWRSVASVRLMLLAFLRASLWPSCFWKLLVTEGVQWSGRHGPETCRK
jgi:hypothetical protein